ncbi:hypothetical protein BDB01DRAFT_833902 [Pilobolus umbonatus]|nr:hypothetical protein BDB01DRAFT_833902 [Pilobolus umbonatus]
MDSSIEFDHFLKTTFMKIEDTFGQKLDVDSILPMLKCIMADNDSAYADKHYAFTGNAVLMLAIKNLLVKKYPNDSDSDLKAMYNRVYQRERLAKEAYKAFKLRQHIKSLGKVEIFESIVGLLFHHFNISAVEGFIAEGLTVVLMQEIKTCPKVQDLGVLYELNHLIHSKEGKIKYTALGSVTSPVWEITLIANLKKDSVRFKHTRIAPSKKKAKIAAAKDVLNYIKSNPTAYNELLQTQEGDVAPIVLPIDLVQYCDIESPESSVPATPVPATPLVKSEPLSAMHTSDVTYIPYRSHDDTVYQLSQLLLSDNSSFGGNSNKRQREQSITKKDVYLSPFT